MKIENGYIMFETLAKEVIIQKESDFSGCTISEDCVVLYFKNDGYEYYTKSTPDEALFAFMAER